jgi:molybdopterin-guanine dinucleotide biosynthesis protein A
MGVDKGTLSYSRTGEDQRTRCARVLAAHCDEVFVSCRADQAAALEPRLRALIDLPDLGDIGPAAGLLTAHRARPDAAWLVLAVDFPFVEESGLSHLIAARSPAAWATCFVHGDGTPEPLLTLWEPAGLAALATSPAAGPRRALERGTSVRLPPPDKHLLLNVNSRAEIASGDFPVRPRLGST